MVIYNHAEAEESDVDPRDLVSSSSGHHMALPEFDNSGYFMRQASPADRDEAIFSSPPSARGGLGRGADVFAGSPSSRGHFVGDDNHERKKLLSPQRTPSYGSQQVYPGPFHRQPPTFASAVAGRYHGGFHRTMLPSIEGAELEVEHAYEHDDENENGKPPTDLSDWRARLRYCEQARNKSALEACMVRLLEFPEGITEQEMAARRAANLRFDRIREQRLKDRNNEAAKRSRQRKVQRIEAAERRIAELVAERDDYSEQAVALKQEAAELRERLNHTQKQLTDLRKKAVRANAADGVILKEEHDEDDEDDESDEYQKRHETNDRGQGRRQMQRGQQDCFGLGRLRKRSPPWMTSKMETYLWMTISATLCGVERASTPS
ncbi:bzip transcription factor [Grosmannia clavigera kw1407]|uniref:Bzip transcription factor n=1 Tax=Grosmannia clavigera (strain kw1407 / UAMH 11150) TaxID=655863 RepID=F0X8I5_GROCL|nr:bzip transcription factor [Grosmannia clavigera kw1407]EFX05245.1 bzip transcription factor [Grosmannia clavigera kw1407]